MYSGKTIFLTLRAHKIWNSGKGLANFENVCSSSHRGCGREDCLLHLAFVLFFFLCLVGWKAWERLTLLFPNPSQLPCWVWHQWFQWDPIFCHWGGRSESLLLISIFPNYRGQSRRQFHPQPSGPCSEEQLCGLQGMETLSRLLNSRRWPVPLKNKTVASHLTDFQAVLAKGRSTHARPAWSTDELQVS